MHNSSMTREGNELRVALRDYADRRDLAIKPWAKRAGVTPSLIFNFLSGRSKSLNYASLAKLARAQHDEVGVLTGEIPDPLQSLGKTGKRENGRVAYTVEAKLTDEDLKNLELILKALQSVAEKLDEQTKLIQQQLAQSNDILARLSKDRT